MLDDPLKRKIRSSNIPSNSFQHFNQMLDEKNVGPFAPAFIHSFLSKWRRKIIQTFENLKLTFELSSKKKCWMDNYLKRIQHIIWVLDEIKSWMKNLIWNKFHPTQSNMIFFFFLKNVGWNRCSQKVPKFHLTLQNLHVGWKCWTVWSGL